MHHKPSMTKAQWDYNRLCCFFHNQAVDTVGLLIVKKIRVWMSNNKLPKSAEPAAGRVFFLFIKIMRFLN